MTKTARSIVQHGDPVLRKHASEVTEDLFGTKKLTDILKEMASALEACDDGVAIAAPQIGVSLRIFTVSHRAFRITKEDEGGEHDDGTIYEDKVFINPEITKVSRKRSNLPEGCLSVRWLYGNVPRHDKATVRAQDEHGKFFTYGASGLLAQIFQHETDHLNGTLFIDTATDIEEIHPDDLKKMNKQQK